MRSKAALGLLGLGLLVVASAALGAAVGSTVPGRYEKRQPNSLLVKIELPRRSATFAAFCSPWFVHFRQSQKVSQLYRFIIL